jgi:hypothetical protein
MQMAEICKMDNRLIRVNSQGWATRSIAGMLTGMQMDVEKGILFDVVLCQAMQPKGAAGESYIENADGAFPVTIKTPVEFIKRLVNIAENRHGENGHQVRFGHPGMCDQVLGSYAGRAKNIRQRGNQVIADIHLSAAAENAPGKGNLRQYILDLAAEDSEAIMMSIVFTPGDHYFINADGSREVWTGDSDQVKYMAELADVDRVLYETVMDWHFTDFVDQGANTNDLFRDSRGNQLLSAKAFEFLDSNPAVWEILSNQPEIVEEFVSKYENYRNLKMNKSEKKAGGLLQRAKSALESVFTAQKSIDATTVDGVAISIQTDADVPAVGDVVFIAGSTETAPAGDHALTGELEGWTITTDEAGVITAVVAPEMEVETETAPVMEDVVVVSNEAALEETNRAVDAVVSVVEKQQEIMDKLAESVKRLSDEVTALRSAPLAPRVFAAGDVNVSNLRGNDTNLTPWEAERRRIMASKK